MQYKTHLATSIAVSIPIMATTDTFSALNLIALGVGTLLPDIDEPQSYIGRRTRGISDVIKLIFGHRGITHTIFATVLIGMVAFFISLKLNIPLNIPLYFTLGYLMHLIGDGFSKSGIAWLLPFKQSKYQLGLGKIYYTTSSLVEYVIFAFMVVICVFELNYFII